jgi:ABC-type cobalamin/Fe3+-siderophores transport system ATPase subunit
LIELRGVELRIGGRALLAGIDARIESGELVAVLGANGAGKTTLLRSIAGLHPLAGGTIRLNGGTSTRFAPLERARLVALVTGDEVLLDALLVRDVVSIGRAPYHRWWEWRERPSDAAAIARAMRAVRIDALAERLFSTLSAGERQRVWIALGLAQETPIVLLDEPTSHLDVRVAHEILALLRGLARAGKSVVCALHDVNEAAAYADRIALLGDGTLLALAKPNELLTGSLLELTYGIAMEHIALPDGRLRVFAREGTPGVSASATARRSPAPNG